MKISLFKPERLILLLYANAVYRLLCSSGGVCESDKYESLFLFLQQSWRKSLFNYQWLPIGPKNCFGQFWTNKVVPVGNIFDISNYVWAFRNKIMTIGRYGLWWQVTLCLKQSANKQCLKVTEGIHPTWYDETPSK